MIKKIRIKYLLLLFLMLLGNNAWAQSTYEEKMLYSTDFQDWTKAGSSKTERTVSQKTTNGKPLDFKLMETKVAPNGTNDKFKNDCITTGYLQLSDKSTTAYIETSPLASITKVKYVQAATGNDRGIKLEVKGDEDSKWVTLSTEYAVQAGSIIEKEIENRSNVRLRFSNLSSSKGAFMTSLEIYGNVEVKSNYTVTYYNTDGTARLGSESVTANSNLKYNTTYTNQVKQNVPSGSAFRGWFNGTGPSAEKVAEGTPVDMDLKLYAKVTPIETATGGSEYTYDLTKNNFYQEDHELIEINGGKYHNDGWMFESEGTILLKVAKNAHIEMTTSTGTTTRDYTGGVPATITLDIPAGTVVKNLQVRNYIPVYVSFDLKDNQGQCPEQILCEPLTGKATLPSNYRMDGCQRNEDLPSRRRSCLHREHNPPS